MLSVSQRKALQCSCKPHSVQGVLRRGRLGAVVATSATTPRYNSSLALLRRWRERIGARRQLAGLCDLDDHILQDIGLTRSELGCETETPFWR
jgi:uncharacterized protein YjiS (DUF1127 family)